MGTRRKICYITGTRADFGLMEATLKTITDHEALELSIIPTGMHLSAKYGNTLRYVESSRLTVEKPIVVDMEADNGAAAANSTGAILQGLGERFAETRPDIVLLLGDRLEMLAAAVAATCLNIPIAHIHGGERSGTIDESLRHAISKLSHIHLVASEPAKDRLIQMGESVENIIVVGAPGLVGIANSPHLSRRDLAAQFGLQPSAAILLVLFHPVVQDAADAGRLAEELIAAVETTKAQAVFLLPNADVGNSAIRAAIQTGGAGNRNFVIADHLERRTFLTCLATFDCLVGNSSSGIIEAASFGIPVVNVGDRQNLRDRNSNVTDVPISRHLIARAIDDAIARGRTQPSNIYSQPDTDKRIADSLANCSLSPELLKKSNTY